jgi:hypothetical protein
MFETEFAFGIMVGVSWTFVALLLIKGIRKINRWRIYYKRHSGRSS